MPLAYTDISVLRIPAHFGESNKNAEGEPSGPEHYTGN